MRDQTAYSLTQGDADVKKHHEDREHRRGDRWITQTHGQGRIGCATIPDQLSIFEKLLVPALSKLSNRIPGAGIWMNTQRPEWNDANNALAGYGLSMVTVAYLRRFLAFLAELVSEADESSWEVAKEVADYLLGVSRVLAETRPEADTPVSPQDRKAFMDRVGQLGSDYRERVYRRPSGRQQVLSAQQVLELVESALAHLDHSINSNRRPDGLYHSYNLVDFGETAYTVESLAEMLEGQVAVLGSGLLEAKEGLVLLDALKRSDLYRADQQSYLLYPDRETKSFLDRNVVPEPLVRESRVIRRELSSGRTLLVEQDLHGKVHFNSAIAGSEELRAAINRAGNLDAEDASELLDIYEAVFRHRAFTGRSSSMYKYEGLGCIYWHMVSKLLLGVGELVADARQVNPRMEVVATNLRTGEGVDEVGRDRVTGTVRVTVSPRYFRPAEVDALLADPGPHPVIEELGLSEYVPGCTGGDVVEGDQVEHQVKYLVELLQV